MPSPVPYVFCVNCGTDVPTSMCVRNKKRFCFCSEACREEWEKKKK